jgi:hypothetical protein
MARNKPRKLQQQPASKNPAPLGTNQLTIDERAFVDAAKGRLRGCVRLLDVLQQETDFSNPEEIDAFGVLVDSLLKISEDLDRVFAVVDRRQGTEAA